MTRRTLSDARALDRIARILSGQEWSADTAPEVAEVVRLTGRAILDPEEVCPECHGAGRQEDRAGILGTETCPECAGTGRPS